MRILLYLPFLLLFAFKSDNSIQKIFKKSIKIPEPSDLCVSLSDKNNFYIVSDNGLLFETDNEGVLIKKSAYLGFDFEGVCTDGEFIYVSEESVRKISVFDKELNYLYSKIINYNGGRNKGIEAITYNPEKQIFIAITERDPVLVREYTKDWILISERSFAKKHSDISAITFRNGFYWILSDEDRTVNKYSQNFDLQKQYKINVLNPEGIVFDSEDNLCIISDDMQLLYKFTLNDENN
jgi:uncharacterized protein YjiK